MIEQTRSDEPWRPCTVCAKPTQWEVWEQAICPEHWRAWQDYEPRIDGVDMTGAQIRERSHAWMAWMAKKTPKVTHEEAKAAQYGRAP